MRTLVVTGSEESMWNVLDLTLNSKYSWCQTHGYDILVKRTWPAKPKLHFQENLKHLGFLRVVSCFEQLRYYDVVMWLDGDSIITNQEYKIEDFIDEHHSFFASYNWMVPESPSGEFTTGNFVITKHDQQNIEHLYNGFIQTSKFFLNHICQELATLNVMYKDWNYRNLIKVLPHKYLNACPEVLVQTKTWINDNNRNGIVGAWNKECFLAHLTGCSTQERYDILKQYFNEYL